MTETWEAVQVLVVTETDVVGGPGIAEAGKLKLISGISKTV